MSFIQYLKEMNTLINNPYEGGDSVPPRADNYEFEEQPEPTEQKYTLIRMDDDEEGFEGEDEYQDDRQRLFNQFLDWLEQMGDDGDCGCEGEEGDCGCEEDPYAENEEEEFQDEMGPEADSEMGPEVDSEMPVDDLEAEDEDPNRAGAIRTVPNAHLVYKRELNDGFYEELWIYNMGKDATRDAMQVKRDILAGTDIDDNETMSKDGNQSYSVWSCGNAQMLHITGLPN